MNRLAELRKERKLSMAQVARDLGMPYTTYVNYEKGTREPNSETLILFANYFSASVDYLVGRSDDRINDSILDIVNEIDEDILNSCDGNLIKAIEKQKQRNKDKKTTADKLPSPHVTDSTVTFPVIGELAAGYDHFMNEEWDTADIIEVPLSYLKGRPQSDFFCLRICGSSMYPLYMDGDRVLIKKTPTLSRSGEIGVVQYGDCATLKKVEYVTGEDWIKLIPINPSYEPETISGSKLEECHIIGVPVLLIRDLQPVVPDEKTI